MKNNTKKVTGWLLKYDVLRGVIAGSILGVLIAGMIASLGLRAAAGQVFLSGMMYFLIAVGISFIVGLIRSAGFRRALKEQLQGSTASFDGEVFSPITMDKSVLMSDSWILLRKGASLIPLSRAHVTGVDQVNARKEGMKKLWMRFSTDKGKQHVISYEACVPDALETAEKWLTPAPAAVICPFCGGTNESNAVKCKWCDSVLR